MAILKYFSLFRSASVTLLGSIGYVAYRDLQRYPRMSKAYSNGHLIFPLNHNLNEIKYFSRPVIEHDLKAILSSTFSNTYYIIKGEVGNGKSRLLIEAIRDLIEDNGSRKLGAPIYISSHQGESFADCVANSVDYRYDEHISFQSFMDSLLKIRPLPGRKQGHKLQRVLNAIEKSSQIYSKQNGRPVVIIIDDIEELAQNDPESLLLLQEKAKLWADSNIAKLVFVCHSEEAMRLLRKSASCWSRAATPLYVNDLKPAEAKQFLMECEIADNVNSHQMSEEVVNEIVELVGGRLQTLIDVKRRAEKGDSIEKMKRDLKQKEREKLLDLEFAGIDEKVEKVLKFLLKSKHVKLSDFDLKECERAVDQLSRVDLVRLRRSRGCVYVEFESHLTRSVVKQFIGKT